jgi:hypothetical protein
MPLGIFLIDPLAFKFIFHGRVGAKHNSVIVIVILASVIST